jgi:Chain length determinant protein
MIKNEQIRNDEITLKEIVEKIKEWYHFLLSKWKTIVLTGMIGGILGIGYSFTIKPIYTASLTFALEDNKSGSSGGVLSLASQFGISLGDGGGSIFEGSNLNELFKSRIMVERTLLTPVDVNGKIISLAEMYIQNAKWRKNWEDDPKLSAIQFLPNPNRNYFTRIHDSIFGEIYGNLSKNSLSVAQKDKKISIISMEVKSNNELFAKYFCEALARQVGQFYITTKSKKARMNMEILGRQTDSIRQELNSAISRVAVANDNTFNLNPALNIRRVPSARKQVDVQANTAILTELVKQTELAKVTVRRETPLIQVLDRPILPLKKEKFGKIKGLVIGVFLAVFLTVFFLSLRRILKQFE